LPEGNAVQFGSAVGSLIAKLEVAVPIFPKEPLSNISPFACAGDAHVKSIMAEKQKTVDAYKTSVNLDICDRCFFMN
jgi:hypothetical protein